MIEVKITENSISCKYEGTSVDICGEVFTFLEAILVSLNTDSGVTPSNCQETPGAGDVFLKFLNDVGISELLKILHEPELLKERLATRGTPTEDGSIVNLDPIAIKAFELYSQKKEEKGNTNEI